MTSAYALIHSIHSNLTILTQTLTTTHMTVMELSVTGLKETSVQSQCHPWVKGVLSLKRLELLWYSNIWNSSSVNSNIILFTSDNGWVGAANILKMFLLKETATGQNKGLRIIVSVKVIVTSAHLSSISLCQMPNCSLQKKEPFVGKQGEVESLSHQFTTRI